MSGKVTGLVLEADLPKDQKAVLVALADHANHDGTRVYPSTDKLIWMTGYERRSVQYALDKLEEKGILVCVVRGGRGPRTPTVWRIALEKLPSLPPFEEWFEARYGRPLGKGATAAPIDHEAAREAEPAVAKGAENAPLASKGAENAPFGDMDESKGAIHDGYGRNSRQLRVQSTTAKGAESAPDPLCDPSVDPSVNRTRAGARDRPSPDRESGEAEAEAEADQTEREPQLAHAYHAIPVGAPARAPARSPTSSALPSSVTARNSELTGFDALTTIGATEDWKTWRAVVDAVNISDAIKDAYLRRAKLYDYGDGRSLLLAAHSNFAAEHIGRFHSTLEMLVGQRLKRCGVRLVIRPIQAVRAEEEALL